MKKSQIELWARDIISRVEAGRKIEDSRAELKSEWPSPDKAARRIAGHANAARGEQILWLIGVNENHGVAGADPVELATWFPQVIKHFDSVAPQMIDISFLHSNGENVTALFFETDRAPFVIKHSGSIQFEVPWREGTMVRSAKRDELLRLLVPMRQVPDLEIVKCELFGVLDSEGDKQFHWEIRLDVYVMHTEETSIVIPFHKSSGSLVIDATYEQLFETIRLGVTPDYTNIPYFVEGSRDFSTRPSTIYSTTTEVFIKGPGMMRIEAHVYTSWIPNDISLKPIDIKVRLQPINIDRDLLISLTVPFKEKENDAWVWSLPI